jgi:integrase
VDRINPERVVSYVEALQALGNSTQTILSRLQELGEAAKVFGPNRDWSSINRLAAKIRARHKPARSKKHLKLSDELVELGFNLMDRALAEEGLKAAILYRDGLLIALTAYAPFRRRNLTAMALDQNLVAVHGVYLLIFDEAETKTRNAQELYVPQALIEPIDVYLRVHRPLLAVQEGRWAKPVTNEVWVSSDGSPMTQMAIYDRIRLHTGEAFGIPMNPHLFRDAAATTLAIHDPQHVRIAAPLLGHRTFATTERYYQQATAMEAHRDYVRAIFGEEEQDDE